jgi:hypothetical protein
LLRHLGLARWSVEELYRAGASFRRTGDTASAAIIIRELTQRAGIDRARLEADLLLQEVRRHRDDAPRAARAVEMLARLMLLRGLPADAVHYYRILGRDFGPVKLPDGRTGAEVLEALPTDKRLLPFLEEERPVPPMKGTAEMGHFAQPQTPTYRFHHLGEDLPFFRRHAGGVRPDLHQFRLIDESNGETEWSVGLTRTLFANMIQNPVVTNIRFPYQTVGNLVVLPVAHMVVGIDPVGRKLLWEKNLLATVPGAPPGNVVPFQQIIPDQRDSSLQVLYPDGWIQLVLQLPLVGRQLEVVRVGCGHGGGTGWREPGSRRRQRPARAAARPGGRQRGGACAWKSFLSDEVGPSCAAREGDRQTGEVMRGTLGLTR